MPHSPDPPVTSDGGLEVLLLPGGALNESSRDWQARMSCGQFHSLGQPPVAVVWRVSTARLDLLDLLDLLT